MTAIKSTGAVRIGTIYVPAEKVAATVNAIRRIVAKAEHTGRAA